MTTPSVPRCGRMDPHEPHTWSRRSVAWPIATLFYDCPGVVVHEGGAQCQGCGSVVCRCDQELADERREEWNS